MLPHRLIRVSAVAVALLLATLSSLRAEPPSSDWIRGTGEHLQIRLRGEVVHADGQPAQDIVVGGAINAIGASHPLQPVIEGNRFELWLPVNQQQWHSMWLRAASTDGSFVEYKRLSMFELRQAAIEGVRLTLQRPTREMKVKVTHQGKAVPNAMVKTDLGYGMELRERTSADGIATFPLLPTQAPSHLTAWTDDFRVGGFSFNRKPTRDPDAEQHEVELNACRDQKLRFVDPNGAPVPDLSFVLQMATLPNYNFIGTNEHSRLTTDENGEVLYAWFPDWDQHYFYPDLQTRRWVRDGDPDMVDGVAVMKVKQGADRKQVSGRTVGQVQSNGGGFFVTLRSFQGETENQSDMLSAFSDINGDFSLNVLPDATYCAWALDSKWCSEVKDLIPYHSANGKVTSPTIAVQQGQPVKVMVTSGESKLPYTNLGISFRREHRFSWQEDGQTRNGVGGPQWWGTTDTNGIATTYALPGELHASVYTPLWRAETKVDVTSDTEPTIIRLHREIDHKRTVTGRLVLAAGLESTLEGAEVQIGSVDGNSDDQQELITGPGGSFSFETLSTEIGIFARTRDGTAAAVQVVEELDSPIVLPLRPTMAYRGQLLGDADQPLTGHQVWASIRVAGQVDHSRRAAFATSFEAKRIETKTDLQGNYTLSGLPSETKVNIRAFASDGSGSTEYLDEVYLQPGETRPLAISHLGKTSNAAAIPLANRYERTLRDCRLMGFRMMIIVSANDQSLAEFVNQHFVNRQSNQYASGFMQIVLSTDAASLPPADVAFLKERKCPLPDAGDIVAYAFDASGEQLERLTLDIAEQAAAEQAVDFVRRNAPQQIDAQKKWEQAFREAKDSKRKVWARISQRYCGPCFLMARWLDDHRELLAKDYVMLKIDDVRDLNGASVAARLTRGGQYGIPFHAIFADDQKLLVDSAGPLGNIGHPSGFESKQHLRSMLLKTRQRLTDAELEQIINSLGD